MKILSLKDKYKGKRCFVIGNGPSLNSNDLEKLKDEFTFAANRIWLMFDKTLWRPSFYFCQDRQMIRGEYSRICDYDFPVFLSYNSITEFSLEVENAICYLCDKRPLIKYGKSMPFSTCCDKYIIDGTTVTYSSIQFAMYMGFSEIYLLGVDNNFEYQMDKNRRIVRNLGVNKTYFDDRYKDVYNQFGQGDNKKFGVTDPVMNEMIYSSAKKEAELRGVKIYNATRGGKLEVFERKDFDSIVK